MVPQRPQDAPRRFQCAPQTNFKTLQHASKTVPRRFLDLGRHLKTLPRRPQPKKLARASQMAYLSQASVLSSDTPPSRVSSDTRYPRRACTSPWTEHTIAPWRVRRNPELTELALARPRLNLFAHSMQLAAARWLVAVLERAGWRSHVAQRIVSYLLAGQAS